AAEGGAAVPARRRAGRSQSGAELRDALSQCPHRTDIEDGRARHVATLQFADELADHALPIPAPCPDSCIDKAQYGVRRAHRPIQRIRNPPAAVSMAASGDRDTESTRANGGPSCSQRSSASIAVGSPDRKSTRLNSS